MSVDKPIPHLICKFQAQVQVFSELINKSLRAVPIVTTK